MYLQFAGPNVNLYRVKRSTGSSGTPTVSRPSTPAGATNAPRTSLDTTTVPTVSPPWPSVFII